MGIRYRLWQFWQALTAKPNADELIIAGNILSPSLLQLFMNMPPREQAHAIRVCKRLINQGETNQSLLEAALLHDIGKNRYPMQLWEKVWIVLGKKWFAGCGYQETSINTDDPEKYAMWKRPFWIAARHAEWGAQILETHHADILTTWLVRNHHLELSTMKIDDIRKGLLEKLVSADQSS